MISRRNLIGTGTAALGLASLTAAPASSGTGRRIHWRRLQRCLKGDLVLPSDSYYVIARQLELGQFDEVNPQAVAYCVNASDVAHSLRFAQDHDLPVAVRSGGHSFGGYSTTEGLVVDVSRLNAVTVGENTADIGPGSQNVDVLNALAAHGMVLGGGGCPTVSSGGFLQGGGFGLLTRPLGMTCDSLVSAEVVLADGRIVTASAQENSDLFWALRGGGGGNFGVVTRFTVTPHAGDQMATAILAFPYDQAVEVMDGTAQWLVEAPDNIGGGAYLNQPDASPGGPVQTSVMVSMYDGTPEELAGEVDRLLALTGQPIHRQDSATTYRDLMMTIYGCAELSQDECNRNEKHPEGQLTRPAFGLERTRLSNGPLSGGGWADVLSAFDADRLAGHARYLDLHMFGGKANDPARTDTAYVHRDSLLSVNYRVLIEDPDGVTDEAVDVATRWVDSGFAVIDPLSNGETYQNWMDPALTDWEVSYYAENYQRLVQIKNEYDPSRFFDSPQSIGARG
ncbi:FAD-binding oxidoreductase [Nocardiopsis sp. YSL2]|uniref:FAD-dependent oxidoreductase n=1 Tax=Nocardiopsis sp. YSL2 TaxID=2939492 RepID=UPI0026F41DBF|nr:FAD-binding oxidoreductase [Nocardiopsis sp. YSL2]